TSCFGPFSHATSAPPTGATAMTPTNEPSVLECPPAGAGSHEIDVGGHGEADLVVLIVDRRFLAHHAHALGRAGARIEELRPAEEGADVDDGLVVAADGDAGDEAERDVAVEGGALEVGDAEARRDPEVERLDDVEGELQRDAQAQVVDAAAELDGDG